MAWVYLLVAGIFECAWAFTMKMSNGFTETGYTVATIIGMVLSTVALGLATKTLPISLAYPIWTGIGAVGTVIIGVLWFKDHISPATWLFVALLLTGIVGIKITSGE